MNYAATIVIPLKRQQDEYLDQSVRSALEQSVTCEVLVVHAADTPASNLAVLEGLARNYQDLRMVLEERPGSFPGAINTGIRQACSDRVGLLLTDDWLEIAAVERCLTVDADMVCTGNTVYYADGRTIVQGACADITMAGFRARPTLEAKARYLQPFFLFRKTALLAVSGLDETIGNYPGIDDYDLIWTLLEHGVTVGIVEQRLYNYRDHEGERLTLADAAQAMRNFEKILRKHGMAEQEIPDLVRRASRWWGQPIHRLMDGPNA